jgi:predicted methyltransferase
LFSPQDLGLLDAQDRDRWQRPDQIMDALKIAEGSVVADLGAGGGWFTIRLARRVGPSGIVYAEDIQRLMLVALERRVEREGLSNVRTVRGTPSDPQLPERVDAALIVDAYHEMEDPANPSQITTLLANIERSLEPHGCLGVIDFVAGGGGPGPDPEERITPETVVESAEAAGLRLVKRASVPPFQFLLIFGRAGGASRCADRP